MKTKIKYAQTIDELYSIIDAAIKSKNDDDVFTLPNIIRNYMVDHKLNGEELLGLLKKERVKEGIPPSIIVDSVGDNVFLDLFKKFSEEQIKEILLYAPSLFIQCIRAWPDKQTQNQRDLIVDAMERYENRSDIKGFIYKKLETIPVVE